GGGQRAERFGGHGGLPPAQPVPEDRRDPPERSDCADPRGRLDAAGPARGGCLSLFISLRRLALLSVLVFVFLTGYTLSALLDLQDQLSADLGENMVWASAQASHQAALF